MEVVKARSGEPISKVIHVNKSVEGKWMNIIIQPLTQHERQVILQEQLLLRNHDLNQDWVCIIN